MNTEQLRECKELIHKYRSYKSESKWKAQCRNELYEKLRPYMLKWIKAILLKWGRYEQEEEILSLSWRAFYDCLKRHDGRDVQPAKYFHDFTRYYLLVHYAKQEKVKVPLEDFKEMLNTIPLEVTDPLNQLITIYELIEEVVPEEHKFIFFDAMQSVFPGPKLRVWSWVSGCGVSQRTYAELKKVYKELIRWILKK